MLRIQNICGTWGILANTDIHARSNKDLLQLRNNCVKCCINPRALIRGLVNVTWFGIFYAKFSMKLHCVLNYILCTNYVITNK